ncbi:hypothetical protein GCM10010387_34420 [Streptomyces inusitatus]|uniref:Uncharacterized protein n=1 Tax=Streptomyces inusitatus TaxID=68221 RepID=A0A918Q8L2_9ACTN|nr:hypothetical protein GCM10010387_34420 [Streptomyces inusitatus]
MPLDIRNAKSAAAGPRSLPGEWVIRLGRAEDTPGMSPPSPPPPPPPAPTPTPPAENLRRR